MTTTIQARAARLAALLNDDGSVSPADHLPDGLLVEEPELETLYLEALTAETIGEGLQTVRTEAGLSTAAVLARRGVTKGRLSQLEHKEVNPQLSSITQQADALDYDVTIVFTPRDKERRAVEVNVKPATSRP
jgi:Helix-turn-helix domain